jgi:Zn-dependent protease
MMQAKNLFAGFFLGLPLNPEDGGKIFLRNVSRLSKDYNKVLNPTTARTSDPTKIL